MLRDTRRSSKPEYRARCPDARPAFARASAWQTISRDANTGVGQDFTGLAAVVQLRLRVAFGLQALQRCSGLLNRRARGSTVATHHFRIRGEIIIILRFERRVCRWESCRMHQFTGMWLNPNSRGSRLRIWQPWGCNSLHAHQPSRFALRLGTPLPLARLALAKAAAPKRSDGGLDHFSATGFSGNSRPRRLKIAEPSGCESRVADQPSLCRASAFARFGGQVGSAGQFGMSTGRASRTCLLNSGLPEKGMWCESTAFRQPLQTATNARVAQREPAALYPASH